MNQDRRICIGKKFDRDHLLTFDEESHTYFVNGNIMSTSVTQLVHKYFPPFLGDIVAKKMVSRSDFLTSSRYSKYLELVGDLDLSKEECIDEAANRIKNVWKEDAKKASDAGTAMHLSIENYYIHGSEMPDCKESKLFLSFDRYAEKLGYIPFRSEQRIWDVDYSIAGSVDMLFIKKENINIEPYKIWIVDWKRSKEIKKFGYSNGYGPMKNKKDCNYEHYSLQLNIYKHLLEKNYKISVERMSIVVLHPMLEDFDIHDIQTNEYAVKQIIKDLQK
jgi:ATP-dependent exoDNAse (exonuclease V) beta subunit